MWIAYVTDSISNIYLVLLSYFLSPAQYSLNNAESWPKSPLLSYFLCEIHMRNLTLYLNSVKWKRIFHFRLPIVKTNAVFRQ